MRIKILKDEMVYDGKYIKTIRRHFLDSKNKPQVWEMVERKNARRSAAIAAITARNEIILEKIFRIPLNAYVLELPAGLADKDGEREAKMAQRELLEETGYYVDRVELLTSGPFNTGLFKDEMAVYLGMNARKIQKPKLESSEDIKVMKVPLEKLFAYLSKNKSFGTAQDKRKIKVDLKLWSIIPLLQRKGFAV